MFSNFFTLYSLFHKSVYSHNLSIISFLFPFFHFKQKQLQYMLNQIFSPLFYSVILYHQNLSPTNCSNTWLHWKFIPSLNCSVLQHIMQLSQSISIMQAHLIPCCNMWIPAKLCLSCVIFPYIYTATIACCHSISKTTSIEASLLNKHTTKRCALSTNTLLASSVLQNLHHNLHLPLSYAPGAGSCAMNCASMIS